MALNLAGTSDTIRMPDSELRWLSKKSIPARERLIFALDTPDVAEAKKLVELLGGTVSFYKLGLEVFMAGGYFEMIDWLVQRNKKTFVDLKFFDVPRTVASAVRQLRGRHATFATVHGNDDILRAACAGTIRFTYQNTRCRYGNA